MAEDIRMLFLKESLNDCEEVYANAVADPKARAWDYLVITAANEAQAQAYRRPGCAQATGRAPA